MEIKFTNDIKGDTKINETETKVRRKRRTKAEIEADKAAALEKKLAKAAAKASKDSDSDDDGDSPKKTKKKGNGQKPIEPKRGQWSDPTKSILKDRIFVEIEILETALGTSPSDKELLTNFIAKNAPDAASREEEIVALGESEVVQKGTTIFPRGWFKMSPNGEHYVDVLDRREGRGMVATEEDVKIPFFWNYQMRGFFKDSCGLLSRASYGLSADLKAYKKVIDGGIMVYPRRLAIDLPTEYYDDEGNLCTLDPDHLPILQRPLRINDRGVERTAIASSEIIPAGSKIKCCIEYMDPKMKPTIIEWLNYGSDHGLGAWRNSGRGIIRWRELNEDWSPIIDED